MKRGKGIIHKMLIQILISLFSCIDTVISSASFINLVEMLKYITANCGMMGINKNARTYVEKE